VEKVKKRISEGKRKRDSEIKWQKRFCNDQKQVLSPL